MRYVGSTLQLPASGGRDVQCHEEIEDPIFLRFGSPIGRAISGSTRGRFPVSESVLGYSQWERVQQFAVILIDHITTLTVLPWLNSASYI